MSYAASRKVWQMSLHDAGAKLVFLNLADRANARGVCWPSQKTIARDTGLSERTVRAKLRQLEDEGLILRTPRAEGRVRVSDLITLRLPTGRDPATRAAGLRQNLPVSAGDDCRQIDHDQPVRLNHNSAEPFWFEHIPEPGRPELFDYNLAVKLAKSVSSVVERADWAAPGLGSLSRLVAWLGRHEYAQLERVLIETAERANRAGSTIKSWKYFAHAVDELDTKRY